MSTTVRLSEVSLFFPQLPVEMDGLRIVHMGDMHTDGYGSRERLFHNILREGCDLFVCTGDSCHEINLFKTLQSLHSNPVGPMGAKAMKTWSCVVKLAEALAVYREILADFNCPLPTFAVQGNHDPHDFMNELAQIGVTVLSNTTQQVDLGRRGRINLCGLCCAHRSAVDIPRTLLQKDPSLFSVALTHHPEYSEALIGGGVDLVLAGHTHGGQLCLPGGRPLITRSGTGTKFASGLARLEQSFVYTTRGLGQTGVSLRTFCPPEIVRLTLHHGPHEQSSISETSLDE